MSLLISLITITYNSELTVRDTIESVFQQSYQDFEYIIVDGASSDATLEIIHDHPVRVDQLISEPDKGLYDALNKGIARATGRYVGFIHSDDCLATTETLALIAGALEKGDDGCYGDLDYVSSVNSQKIVRHWNSGRYSRNDLKNGWMPPHETLYLKKSIYQEKGGFDISLRISSDYDLIVRFLYVAGLKLVYIPEVLVKMKVGGASNRSLANIVLKMREDVLVMRKHGLWWPIALTMKNFSKLKQFF